MVTEAEQAWPLVDTQALTRNEDKDNISKFTHFLSFSLVSLLLTLLSVPLRTKLTGSEVKRAAEGSDSEAPEAASADALAYRA